MYRNYVRIIALNKDRCLAEKLMKYDIEKALEEDRLNEIELVNDDKSDEEEEDNLKIVRLFKRKGDHLLIIKNDNSVSLYNLFNDEIVYQTKLSKSSNLNQTGVAVLNQKTKILAVLNNQIIVEL